MWLIQYGKERRLFRACRNAPVLETPEPAFRMDEKAMSTNEPTTQEGTATELTDFDARPEDCDCVAVLDTLPCWPCYRDGFREPNPRAGEE